MSAGRASTLFLPSGFLRVSILTCGDDWVESGGTDDCGDSAALEVAANNTSATTHAISTLGDVFVPCLRIGLSLIREAGGTLEEANSMRRERLLPRS
jgi:hypothetical protein